MRRGGRIAIAAALLLAVAAQSAPAADPRRGEQWNLTMVESDEAHATTLGAGALVAIVDSGAQFAHEDLQGALVAGRDQVQEDDSPQDEHGHGTHTAGIVVANKDNGRGVSSVAPGARALVIRVLNRDGEGSNEDVAAGIDHARARGAQVINLSLAEDVPFAALGLSSEVEAAVRRALDAGIVVVAAAGNRGVPICEQDVAEGRVLCVGAVDKREQKSYFSSFGQGLGLVAPGGSGTPIRGEDVLAPIFDPENPSSNSQYAELGGTSEAAPHVSGVAALLVSRGVRGEAAVRRILATARDVGPAGPDPTYGAGIVNARAAVASTGSGPAPGRAGARVSIVRGQTIGSVLRRGLRVRCRAAGNGRCTVTARARGRRIVRGSRALVAGRTRTVAARATRAGRRTLRRSRRIRLRVRVTLPGSRPVVRRVTLRRRR